MPKDPDRSHLADAIHFMDLIDLADEELPVARAAVEQAKTAAFTARTELDKHQQWLGQHQELYTEAIKGCERHLRRQALITACKQTAWVPVQSCSYFFSDFFAFAFALVGVERLPAPLRGLLNHESTSNIC